MILFAVLLPCLLSCSRIPFLNRNKQEKAKYTNADYHFSLTYPSYFSEIVETESTENKDEFTIEIKNTDTDVIKIEITYKKADDLYHFAVLSDFEKNKIKPVYMEEFPDQVNCFIYDKRECPSYEKPTYYLFASTKRMLYTVSYSFERGDENADKVCDTLGFEFDMYANVPKNSQFMSPRYIIAGGYASVSVPADATVRLYPDPWSVPSITADPETGEVIRPDYKKYNKLEATSKSSYFLINLPDEVKGSLADMASAEFDEKMKAAVSELAGARISRAEFEVAGTFTKEGNVNYRKLYFTCLYNGSPASGTVVIGFTGVLRYFENIYVVINDASPADTQNYKNMLSSLAI